MPQKLTVSEVIERLGGNKKVAELLEVTPPAVSNYKAAGRFPDRLHYKIFRECQARGIEYDPHQEAQQRAS